MKADRVAAGSRRGLDASGECTATVNPALLHGGSNAASTWPLPDLSPLHAVPPIPNEAACPQKGILVGTI